MGWYRWIWPGKGPFSHLPPWLRPGWVLGRGWCRYYAPAWLDREEERRLLEDYSSALREEIERLRRELEEVEERLERLRETRG